MPSLAKSVSAPPSGFVPSPERVHLSALDGVRGVAILMVMLMHSLEGNFDGPSRAIRTLGDFINLGRLGVDLFFVLSGFLITGILIDTRQDPHFFRRFYVRRTLRIFPLYYGFLLLLLLLTPAFHLDWHGMFLWMLAYLQNFQPMRLLTLHVGNIGMYHLWSLAVEEQFYLVWPFLVFLLRGKRRSVGLAAAVLAVAVVFLRVAIIHSGHGIEYIHVGMFTRADQLLCGAILAVLYRSNHWWPRVLALAPWIFLLPILIYLGIWSRTNHLENASIYFVIGLGYTIFAVSCVGAMTWALKPGSTFQRIMQLPALRTLGKYSYGLYIIHVPVLTLLAIPTRQWLRLHFHSRVLAMGLTAVLLLSFAFLLAWASYNFFEKHFLRLKHRFDYTRVAPARPAA